MTWRCGAAVAIVFAFAAAPSAASAACATSPGNLVADCSFEQQPIGDGSFGTFGPGTTFGGWTVSAGGDAVDLANRNFAGGYPVADGNQSLDLNHDSPGGAEQRVPTTAGATYRVLFQLSGYPAASANCSATQPQVVDVRANGTAQRFSFTPSAGQTPPGNQRFELHEMDFAASGQTLLQFKGVNAGCAGPIIDDVSVSQTTTPQPVLGRSMVAAPRSGTILVRLPNSRRFVRFTTISALPTGSIVDARHGVVRITATSGGKTYFADFYQGEFVLHQLKTKGATADLVLFGGSFKGCPKAPAFSSKSRSVRHLWGSGSGSFRTVGRFSSATVRGTKWLTDDQCKGTLTRVVSGRVLVRDFVRKRNVAVRAGKSYFAAARG